MRKLLCSTLALVATTYMNASFGESAVGLVTMRVISQLSIQNLGELSFKVATPGAVAETLSPDTNSDGSGFIVAGEPGMSVSIIVPKEVELTSMNSSQSIRVKDFTTSTGAKANLGTDGTLHIGVGATREALPKNLKMGTYSGQYIVQVIY